MLIEEIMKQIMIILREEGRLKEKTLKHYEDSALKHLTNYFRKHNELYFNEKLLHKYLKDNIQKEKKGQIKGKRLREIKRVINMVNNFVDGKNFIEPQLHDTKLYKVKSIYENFFEEFIKSLSQNYSQSTIETINFYLRVFLNNVDINKINLESITNEQFIEIYQSMLNKCKGDIYNVRLAMRIISKRVNKLFNSNIIDISIIKLRKRYIRMVEPYTNEEIDKMIKYTHLLSKRDKAIFYIGIYTGLRACDIKNLTIECIDWKEKTLKFIQSKTSNPNIIPLNNELLYYIKDYILNERPKPSSIEDEKIIFLSSINGGKCLKRVASMDRILYRLEKYANIKHIKNRAFHSCRRYFATFLINNEIELYTVSQLLGHKDFSTDRRYISFEKNKVAKCAMNFNRIPIKGGIYYDLW